MDTPTDKDVVNSTRTLNDQFRWMCGVRLTDELSCKTRAVVRNRGDNDTTKQIVLVWTCFKRMMMTECQTKKQT